MIGEVLETKSQSKFNKKVWMFVQFSNTVLQVRLKLDKKKKWAKKCWVQNVKFCEKVLHGKDGVCKNNTRNMNEWVDVTNQEHK